MADVFNKQKRSEVMSRIRSRGNADTELALAKLLRANRITGWRRQLQVRIAEPHPTPALALGRRGRSPRSALRVFTLRPDFVFPRSRTALFVDGCFWHGCPQHGTQPKGNAAFWRRKFAANRARDCRVNRILRRAGWQVLRVWEHELRQSGKRKAKGGKTKVSTLRPGPAYQPPGRGTGPTGCRPDPPTRRGQSVDRGTPAVVRRIQRAIAPRE